MSAIGPKQTSLVAPHMSAFGSKAGMTFYSANVYFGPKEDRASTLQCPKGNNGTRPSKLS